MISSRLNPSEKLKMDSLFFMNEKKEKVNNSYKMQKILKKLGTKSKLNEIQRMLVQIQDQKKREKKMKNVTIQTEYNQKDSDDEGLRRISHMNQRFSLNNIKNIIFQNEELEKNHEFDEYETKKNIAAQAVGQAHILKNHKKTCAFDFKTFITESKEDPINAFKAFKGKKNKRIHSNQSLLLNE